jgi:lipoprotein-anchoring transpeptidase ErfK/SrfK
MKRSLCIAVVAGVLLVGCSTVSQPVTQTHRSTDRQAAPTTTTTTAPPPVGTELATVTGATWEGAPEILPVIAQSPTQVEVRLPQRPNGSTEWIDLSAVTLSSTPYVVDITLSTHTLTLLDNGAVVFSAPIGNGAPNDPTPTGNFFVAYKGTPPSADYGPWVLVTSAHSDAIADWQGDPQSSIGIHGPLGEDALIPGAISHGCIRLHLSDLAQLAVIPAGTPVNIS